MKKAGVRNLRGDKQEIEGDLILKKGKVYVLRDKKLRIEIIQLHYDMLVAGYGGRWKMMELVTRNYWWPEIMKDVEKYMEECDLC